MPMKLKLSNEKMSGRILSARHAEVYFLLACNILAFLGMLFERNSFLHAIFVPICLSMSAALILSILIEKYLSHTATLAGTRNSIIALGLEAATLFFLPLFSQVISPLLLIEILFVALLQGVAILFLAATFRKEAKELFTFISFARNVVSNYASIKIAGAKNTFAKARFIQTRFIQTQARRSLGREIIKGNEILLK